MQPSNSYRYIKTPARLLGCLLLMEYVIFIFSGISFSFLTYDSFFSLPADPVFGSFFGSGIPQFIISHHWVGLILDILILLLLGAFAYDPLKRWVAITLFVLLFIFYITLMGYLTHRNYQFGFFLVLIPFLFKKPLNNYYAYEALRYFLLFFYFSAALLKFINNALVDPAHFSHLLSSQFTVYYLEGKTGFRTDLNLYLINHINISYALYIVAFFIELFALVGFFTKKFDKLIALGLYLFHLTAWLIMDIGAVGQLSLICLLFLSTALIKDADNSYRIDFQLNTN